MPTEQQLAAKGLSPDDIERKGLPEDEVKKRVESLDRELQRAAEASAAAEATSVADVLEMLAACCEGDGDPQAVIDLVKAKLAGRPQLEIDGLLQHATRVRQQLKMLTAAATGEQNRAAVLERYAAMSEADLESERDALIQVLQARGIASAEAHGKVGAS